MTAVLRRLGTAMLDLLTGRRARRQLACDMCEADQRRRDLEAKTHQAANRLHVLEFEAYGRPRDERPKDDR